MPQRTWKPRVTGRSDAPDDGGRRLAPAAPVADADRAAVRRARVAARASSRGRGWLWPHWLERQLDPRSTAFLPGGHLPFLANLTGRNWTSVGILDSAREATVDPRGLVTPWPGGWSLDWWVGADDRWHVPSREAAARQHLVGGSPVVETALRIPTGDAVHRAFAVRRSSAEGGGELVIVEVENRSKLPVALALALRPYGPAGLAPVGRIDVAEGGTTVLVDDQVALLLPRAPARWAASSAADGDSAATTLAGDAGERWPGAVRCPDGLAQAAFVFPLAHEATLRVALPLAPERAGRRSGAPVAFPTAVPGAEQVAAGWRSQAARGLRVEMPDERLAEAVDANRRFLLLRHDGLAGGPGRPVSAAPRRDEAVVLAALDDYGYHDEAAAVLAGYPAAQRTDGAFGGRDEPGANGAALWALGRHWRLARDGALVDDMAEALARGAQWVERARTGTGLRHRGPRREEPALAGLLPPASAPGAVGGPEYAYADDLWALAGLAACADVLDGTGQAPASGAVRKAAAALAEDLDRSLSATAERLGTAAVPFGPRRGVDVGAAATLAAVAPLGLLAAGDPRLAATAEALRAAHVPEDGHAVYDPARSGLSPGATLALAAAEVRAGDPRALDRLAWLLDAASVTWAWPGAVHPRLGGGCAGDGHDAVVAATFLSIVRDLLVHEAVGEGAPGLVLSVLVPPTWLGQGWEVHDAPTAHGALSYAVRWHGDRPALLWDLERHDGAGPVRLTIPGLDPAWSTTEARGETLLAAVAPPAPAEPHDDTPGDGAVERVAPAAPADPAAPASPAAPAAAPPAARPPARQPAQPPGPTPGSLS